jgi:soluble lytic murein transglycosylase-like protein
MKQSTKQNLLACLVFAGGTVGMLAALHLTRSDRSTLPAAEPNGAVQRVLFVEKRVALKVAEVHALIEAASKKHGVPTALVKSIVAAESSFQCDAVSSKGAVGLMQLQPSTAQQYGADAAIPEQNIDAGTRHLRFLIERYRHMHNPLKYVIAAYNAGCGAVDRYHGVPPFRETRGYVVRVLALFRHYQRQSG